MDVKKVFNNVSVGSIGESVKSMKKHKWFLIISGVIMTALGIYSIFHPGAAILSVAFALSFGFLIAGANHIMAYFVIKGENFRPTWLLLQGALECAIGFILLSKLGVTALSIPIMVAFWSMFDGITRIIASFDFKANGAQKWWVTFAAGVVSILFALLLLGRPFAGVIAVTFYVGISMMFWGVGAIIEAFHLY